MPTYTDLIELARICRRMAQSDHSASIRAEFLRMADEYERRADALAPTSVSD
ncbi:MAG TPA: hypothetical protein VKX28_29170 [Xanthobacteraceae bacterium]|nr:hypothetical protein [Xanthobacteraceae bacterium]